MPDSSTGLKSNIAALISYLFAWVSGLVFFLIEKKSPFVKFHALQSLVIFGILTLASLILGWIPVIGSILSWIIGVVMLAVWIIGMVVAYQGKWYVFPLVGKIVKLKAG